MELVLQLYENFIFTPWFALLVFVLAIYYFVSFIVKICTDHLTDFLEYKILINHRLDRLEHKIIISNPPGPE